MSGPQFINIQTYSRKPNPAGNSIDQLDKEAKRDPEYSLHIDDPKPPFVLLGNIDGFKKQHDDHVAARSTSVRLKDGSVKTRAIRQDRQTMASIVVSYPVPLAAINTPEQKSKLVEWQNANLKWLQDTYGDQLKVVFGHTDEAHPHLHAWLLPDDPGADATTLHPGKMEKKRVEAEAKKAGIKDREAVKLGNDALKERMREWQDEYHAAVGAPLGLTRTGPNRRRLSRAEWKAEKAETARQAEALKSLKIERAEVTEIRAAAQSEAAATRGAAAAAMNKAKEEAAGIRAEAQAERNSAGQIFQEVKAWAEATKNEITEKKKEADELLSEAQAVKKEAVGLLHEAKDAAADLLKEAHQEAAKVKAEVIQRKNSLGLLIDEARMLISTLSVFGSAARAVVSWISSRGQPPAEIRESVLTLHQLDKVMESDVLANLELGLANDAEIEDPFGENSTDRNNLPGL